MHFLCIYRSNRTQLIIKKNTVENVDTSIKTFLISKQNLLL